MSPEPSYRIKDNNIGACLEETIDVSSAGGTRRAVTQQVELDGGAGNDIVVVSAGAGSVAVGGLGRDVVINRSAGGLLYGDVQNSNGDVVADTAANSDLYWWASNTTIVDAQRAYWLQFYGVTLMGGDASAASVGLAVSARFGYTALASQVISQITLVSANNTITQNKKQYYDTFLTNIVCMTERNADGGIDLLVYNKLTPFVNLAYGDKNVFTKSTYDPVTGAEIPNPLAKSGIMRIKNFDMANASQQVVEGSGGNTFLSGFNAATLQGYGDLNMVFRDRSALAAIQLLQGVTKGIPIVQSVYAAMSALALADGAAWIGAAAEAANDNELCTWREAAFQLNNKQMSVSNDEHVILQGAA